MFPIKYINCIYNTAKQKFDKVKSQLTTVVHCSTPTFNNDLVFTLIIQLTYIENSTIPSFTLIIYKAKMTARPTQFQKRTLGVGKDKS